MCKESSGLKMFLLLSCCITVGITAKAPPMMHYGLKNSSLFLQVGISPPFTDGRWLFDNDGSEILIIINKNVTPKYANKVDFNPKDFSLCINKLTEKDNGIYTASVLSDFEVKKESHRLIVQETVPRPVIKMSLMSSNLSAGSCNITVNCSIQDEWVWAVCDEDSCRMSQSAFRKVNITISAENRSVVCTGNNYVSTRNVSESIEGICFNKSNPQNKEKSQLLGVTLIVKVIAVAVCLTLCAFIVFMVMRLFSSRCNHQQTSSAQLIQNQPVEAQQPPVPRVSSSSSSEAEASYENVDATQTSQASSPTSSPGDESGSKESQKVDSVYCFLQMPNVTASAANGDSSKDSTADMKIQEASASKNEALKPAPIDTVYSFLQKPKKSEVIAPKV